MSRLMEAKSALKLGLMPTVFVTVAALYFAKAVLIPLAVAILLAFMLAPAAKLLERWRLGRIASVLIVVGIVLGAVGAMSWTVERQLVQVAEKLPDYRVNIQNRIRRFQGAGGRLSKAARGVEGTLNRVESTQPSTAAAPGLATAALAADTRTATPALPQISPQNPLPVREYAEPQTPLQTISRNLGWLVQPLVTVGLIVIFLIFMLLNRKDLRERLIDLTGDAQLNLTTQALDDAAKRIGHYLLMQSIINAGYGVCIGVALWVIGLCSAEGRFPNILLWAFLAAILRFVPYVGPLLGAAAPVALSLAVFNNAGIFVATLCTFLGVALVVSFALEPWLCGSSAGLSAMAILVAAVFWTWLWGAVGLLLSTPLTVCVAVLGKYVPQLRPLEVILGGEPPPTRSNEKAPGGDRQRAVNDSAVQR